MSEDIIDVADALERVQDDKELLLELFDIFREDFEKKRQSLRAAFTQNHIDELKDVIHSVKGATGNIGARAMNATCIRIEEIAKGRNTGELSVQLDRLDQQFEDFKRRADQVKKEFGP